MAELFEVKIISPEKILYEGQSSFVEFATVEGRIGVYPKHIPLTTILAPGVIKIHHGETVEKIEVAGGFAEILPDRITVLAENS